ncbi:MAG: hypothetical protein Q9M39_01800 [Sulfurovum sp.]|nr:hypothetical protein [Sulfurovum sp.]
MSKNLKISFYLYNIVLFFFFVFSFVYMSRSEFMPYHSIAVHTTWSEVPSNFKILILVGIHIVGSLLFIVSSAIAIILHIPFKQGVIWAKYTVGVLSLLVAFSLLYTVLYMRSHTDASPPYYPLVAIICIILLSLFYSFRKSKIIANEI